jgi:hypothetical protein
VASLARPQRPERKPGDCPSLCHRAQDVIEHRTLQLPEKGCSHDSAGIDDNRRWDADDAVSSSCRSAAVVGNLRVAESELALELARGLKAVAVRDADDSDVARHPPARRTLEQKRLFATRNAPGCPEVQDRDAST